MTNIQKVREWVIEKCSDNTGNYKRIIKEQDLLSFLDTLEEERTLCSGCVYINNSINSYPCTKCSRMFVDKEGKQDHWQLKPEYHSKSEMRRVEHMKKVEAQPRTIIISNKIKCLKCGDIIESKSVHDFVTCSCGAVSVDGGESYLKRCGEFENFEEMSEFKAE